MNKIAIYGVGAFGYAILKHFDNKQDDSYQLVGYDALAEVNQHLSEKRSHPFFHTDTQVSERPSFVHSPEELLVGADIVVLGVSSDATREVAQTIKNHAKPGITIINIAKALDKTTGKRLSEIMAEELDGFDYHYSALAGGTIADDLFHHEPLGIDIASTSSDVADELQRLFSSSNLKVYTTNDLAGVEYASALKNVISILAGIVHGLGFSYGSETHIISRTAFHVGEICVDNYGARPETFGIGSQSWGNDMWMSCTGDTRNRALGELLGKGTSAKDALAEMHAGRKLVEGVNTLQILDQLPAFKEIEVIKFLHDIIVEQTTDVESIKDFLLKHR